MFEATGLADTAAAGGALLIACSGLLVMLQQRRWAGRLFLGGVVLAGAAAIVPKIAMPSGPNAIAAIHWQWAAALVALVAAAFRQWGAAIAFASPLFTMLFIWPIASTLPTVLLVILFALFAIGAVSRALTMLWGPEVAGHVVGTYVVRLIDAIFLAPLLLIKALFRAR